jgi:hypothetical protein
LQAECYQHQADDQAKYRFCPSIQNHPPRGMSRSMKMFWLFEIYINTVNGRKQCNKLSIDFEKIKEILRKL